MPARAEVSTRHPAAALFAAGLASAAALCASACSTVVVERRPLIALQPAVGLELSSDDPAAATRLRVTVSVGVAAEAPDQALTIAGIRDGATTPSERSLLDLTVHWTDFRADQPRWSGRTQSFLLPFVESGIAEPGAPLIVIREVELPAPDGLVLRRVNARGRIIGVDLQLPVGHSGGTLLTLPDAVIDTLPPAPPGSLDEHLQSRSVPGIFLAAASAPAAEREEVLGTLIRALPATPEPAQSAIYAALLYLTGETHGRDLHRWRSWWIARSAPPLKG